MASSMLQHKIELLQQKPFGLQIWEYPLSGSPQKKPFLAPAVEHKKIQFPILVHISSSVLQWIWTAAESLEGQYLILWLTLPRCYIIPVEEYSLFFQLIL